jgi:hypothetical protein
MAVTQVEVLLQPGKHLQCPGIGHQPSLRRQGAKIAGSLPGLGFNVPDIGFKRHGISFVLGDVSEDASPARAAGAGPQLTLKVTNSPL